ncbi:MAG TPA: hypothetical protein VIC35_06475 [Acidimicrobiia bacterium]
MLLAPLVVLAIHALLHPHSAPAGDQAILQLRVADVGTRHTPLVGSYQRFGWNQPGPAYLYLLAVPYRLFGSNYAALQVGALLVNALAIAGTLFICFKRGGLALYLWAAALLAVMIHAMGPATLAGPWEPDVSILALALTIVLAADVVLGRAWSIPALTVLTVFLVQGWATTAPVAAVLFLWAVAAFIVRAFAHRAPVDNSNGANSRAAAHHRAWLLPVIVAVAVLVVSWIPPVVQQLRTSPGNIGLIAQFIRQPHTTLGLADGYRAVALQLGTRAPWMGWALPLQGFVSEVNTHAAQVVPVVLVLLIAGCAFAARRRDSSLAFGATATLAVLTMIVALSRLVGGLFVEIVEPTWAIGWGALLAAGWCGYSPLGARTRRTILRVAVPALSIVVLLFGSLALADATGGPPANPPVDRVVRQVADRAVGVARTAHGPVLVSTDIDVRPGVPSTIGPGLLVLTLSRAGIDAVVGRDLANRFGDFRADPSRAVLELRMTSSGSAPAGSGWRRVTTVDPLTAKDHSTRDRLEAELERRLGPGLSPAQQFQRVVRDRRLRALDQRISRFDVQPALTLWARRIAKH